MNLRWSLILLLLTASEFGADAQGYFCGREGAKLEYVRKSARDGGIEWRHVMTVSYVRDWGDATVITAASTFLKSNGKPLYRSDVTEKISVDSRGNVTADMESGMVSYIKARAGLNATASSTRSVLPADMQPGDTLPPVSGTAKVGILTYTFRVWDRKVLREETITVPAGTFSCVVLEERKLESGPGHNRDVRNITWYSKGVGYVRHDTYIKGVMDTSETLESVHF